MEQALSLFKAVDLLPEKRWAGDLKERTKNCTAFGRFRDGLLQELRVHAAAVGEVTAIAELERERQGISDKGNHSQLQILANRYRKRHRA